MTDHSFFLKRAIQLAATHSAQGAGGPFGAVIVKDNTIIGEGWNQVTSTHDPTAHAEMVAIRQACLNLNAFHLEGALIYTSCEPCPMCLGAIYWARLDKIYFALNRKDAANIGFDDDFIYQEIALNPSDRSIPAAHLPSADGALLFESWQEKLDKVMY